MNKQSFTVAFIFSLTVTACTNVQDIKEEQNLIRSVSYSSNQLEKKALDLERSKVKWKATKLLRTAGHEGVVNIREGELFFDNDVLAGGKIIVDVNTIAITETSKYSAQDIRMLENYLKKKEFNVVQYPVASFEILQVRHMKENNIEVLGNMCIKDETKKISFPAKIERFGTNMKFTASLTLDRNDYKIGIDGNLLEKNLVDDEFELTIDLIL